MRSGPARNRGNWTHLLLLYRFAALCRGAVARGRLPYIPTREFTYRFYFPLVICVYQMIRHRTEVRTDVRGLNPARKSVWWWFLLLPPVLLSKLLHYILKYDTIHLSHVTPDSLFFLSVRIFQPPDLHLMKLWIIILREKLSGCWILSVLVYYNMNLKWSSDKKSNTIYS
jgi:hypothetical protein